jgi:type II secretory ATPase GspE/PulE/Tfp pilus assembly ATPase PilB-like protein
MAMSLDRLLEQRKLLPATKLAAAQKEARDSGEPLFAVLLRDGLVPEAALLQAVAEEQALGFVDLRETRIEPDAVRALTPRFVSHYLVMPVRLEQGRLTVAVSNPFDMAAIEDMETHLGLRVERVLACRDDIREAIRRTYGVGADTVARLVGDLPAERAAGVVETGHDLERGAEDASVVELVNQILSQAINDRATDIHFEIFREGVVLRRRIDGVLYDTPVPADINLLYPAMVSRVKLMAGLDIVERRLPQDGRTGVNIGEREYDLRISVVPSLRGENVVVRILPARMLFSLNELGLAAAHLEQMQQLLAFPHGIIFVTGPTGSGKSTTLYACLKTLNTRERKIITIEDPVEYEIRGLTQTQVNPRIGLTFARALRSMLRHDPDVMMVGEVRDRETAEITVQTALTGHLVLSTLHTNSAAGAAVRLLDMGVDAYLIASTVRAFIAQRLVRVICPECREEYREAGEVRHRGRGCRRCHGSGYRGRVAVCEFLAVSPEIQDLILRRASAREVQEQAVGLGMTTMADDGRDKISAGVTTEEEILRVTRL